MSLTQKLGKRGRFAKVSGYEGSALDPCKTEPSVLRNVHKKQITSDKAVEELFSLTAFFISAFRLELNNAIHDRNNHGGPPQSRHSRVVCPN